MFDVYHESKRKLGGRRQMTLNIVKPGTLAEVV
jgi:hypothetical protein